MISYLTVSWPLRRSTLSPAPVGQTHPHSQKALELYSKSSASFRERLGDITAENCYLYFVFSLFTVAMNLALPRVVSTIPSGGTIVTLDSIRTFFELGRGARRVVTTHEDAFFKSYPSAETVRRVMEDYTYEPTDDQTKQIIGRLAAITDQLHPPTPDEGSPAFQPPRPARDMYRFMVRLLGIYHVEDEKGTIKGLYLSAANRAGDDFVFALNRLDPLALLLLMHWGVLMERHSDVFWWTRSVGKDLMEEILPFIQQSALVSLPLVREHITWLRHEAGLGST